MYCTVWQATQHAELEPTEYVHPQNTIWNIESYNQCGSSKNKAGMIPHFCTILILLPFFQPRLVQIECVLTFVLHDNVSSYVQNSSSYCPERQRKVCIVLGVCFLVGRWWEVCPPEILDLHLWPPWSLHRVDRRGECYVCVIVCMLWRDNLYIFSHIILYLSPLAAENPDSPFATVHHFPLYPGQTSKYGPHSTVSTPIWDVLIEELFVGRKKTLRSSQN